jgi:hypothetical protein
VIGRLGGWCIEIGVPGADVLGSSGRERREWLEWDGWRELGEASVSFGGNGGGLDVVEGPNLKSEKRCLDEDVAILMRTIATVYLVAINFQG